MATHKVQWVTVLLMAMVLVAYSGILLSQDAADTPAGDKPAAGEKPAADDTKAKADDEEKPTAPPAGEKKDDKKSDEKADEKKDEKADEKKSDEKADEKKADEKKADAEPMGEEKKDEKAEEKKDEKADEKKEETAGPAPEGKVEGVDKKLARQWEDLLHYIKIAQIESAKSAAETFTDGSIQPKDIYQLSEEYPDSRAVISRGAQLEGMKDICGKLHSLIEDGYQVVRSDPKVIAATIEMLGGSLRAYELAVRRLKQSGEFAMPQLVQQLAGKQTPELIKVRIVTALPHLGNECVRAMSQALKVDKPEVQEILCNTLGRIGYIHCAPQLKELAEDKSTLPRVKNAALLALETVAGPAALKKPVAELYYDMALKYYYQDDSIRPDPRYAQANVWYWEANLGLSYKPVPREIFCDVYAMRCSRQALQHDEKFFPAISLWLSAYLKKEVDLPKGAADPIKGAEQQAARFYALASSAEYVQQVLARALRDNNIPVAMGAINALTETSGANNLISPIADGSQPLVEALMYRDRRVRFLAAVSLAQALPPDRFTGYEVVMHVLNEALRQGGKKRVVIIADKQEARNAYKQSCRDAGFEIIEDSDAVRALTASRAAGGIDAFVLCASPEPIQVIGMIRSDPLLASLPVVVQARTPQLKELAGIDKRVVLVDPLGKEEEIAKAVSAAAVETQPLTEEESTEWAVRAAKTVRHVGLAKSPVFDCQRAMQALIGDLGHTKPEIQIASAEALAVMNCPEAQQGVVLLGVKADAPENVRIAAFDAASESVRRFGKLITEAQAASVREVVMGKGTPALLSAAAKLLGSLNLPSQEIKPLILSTEGMD